MWQQASRHEGNPVKTSLAACGAQYLSWGHLAKGHRQGTGLLRESGARTLEACTLRFWALEGEWASEGCSPMAQVKEEAKGTTAAEKEEGGLRGVTRSEFRTESGSRRTEENREPRRTRGRSLTFTLLGGGRVCDALGWRFIACRSKERGC